MKKAIVIGASSGIGRQLAKVLAENEYAVGLVGRRTELLQKLQKEIASDSYIASFDISQAAAKSALEALIQEMNGVELIVISAGCGFLNPDLDFAREKETIEVNVVGFAAMANVAFKYFQAQGNGHIVGLSSIAAIRGSAEAPAYSASKAFVSNYLEGLRKKAGKLGLPITVTNMQPGFVDTAMAQGDGLFWVASPEEAARQIYEAIDGKKNHAYITKRWGIIAGLLKIIPNWLYNKI
ncbi:MAG TPA: SDR family NAD(P)-dependent oxidoreductase [Patescibacteria group bacterium]|nr:SDR family NAD(P)-dependent oxidoreductase [Patescibacteria group bacterium]